MFIEAVQDTTAIMAAGTALTGSVGYLFKLLMDLSKKQTEQAEKLGEYKGRQEGITELSEAVLMTVHKAAVSTAEELVDLLPDEHPQKP